MKPRLPSCSLSAALLFFLLACSARGDDVTADGFPYRFATILGIRNDKLAFSLNGRELSADLDKISALSVDKAPKFNQAEECRDSDAKKAAALYKDALKEEMTAKALRPIAQLRAIAPTDADGRYTEALTLFLNVYQQFPTPALWSFRPTHVPAPGSTMLKESADLISNKLPAFTDADARKNLQLLEVDLYGKAGDTRTAANLARVVTGAAPDAGTAGTTTAAPDENVALTAADLAPIEDALKTNPATALTLVDKLLPRANADGAAQLFMIKARAYAASSQPDLAAATYLRVPIHYPKAAAAPAALLAAANLQKTLNHPEEAARLLKELAEKYPDAPEALKAK